MKKTRNFTALCLAFVLAFACFGVSGEETESIAAVPAFGLDQTLENDGYRLDFIASTGEILFTDKSSGSVWRSNPENAGSDETAVGQNRNNLLSQIIVEYYDGQNNSVMDSYSQGIKLGKELSCTVESGKLSVAYDLGEDTFSADMLPKIISKKRMAEVILPKLTKEERATVLTRYTLYERDKMDKELLKSLELSFPIIKKHDIFVLGNLPDYITKEVYDLFVKAGYTTEDLERDCEENGIENTYQESPYFTITVDYTLTEDGFFVSVDPAKIEYSEDYRPNRIEILPYFGAANAEEQGYLLVPDGSGALIEYRNHKQSVGKYWKKLFGEDAALTLTETGANSQPSVLPYFGMVKEQGGFIASIDQGFEAGGITATVSGMENSYCAVSAFFDLFISDAVSITSNQYDTFRFNSKNIFSSGIGISYHFVSGTADYSALAGVYRRHLQSRGLLPETLASNNRSINLEFIASAEVSKKFLGIPYTALDSLTTFSQASQITEELGISDVDVRFINVLEGGRQQKRADSLKTVSTVGKWKDFTAEVNHLYLSYYAQSAVKVKKSDTALTLSKDKAKIYRYDPVSRYFIKGDSALLISAMKLPAFAEKIRKAGKKAGVSALCILDIGYSLNSDFGRNYADRSSARKAAEQYLGRLSEGNALAVESGSIFSLRYADKIWNIATGSDGYLIEDASVPFYQLVINGVIPYTATPVNVSSSEETAVLKAVETGAQLQYSWIYRLPDSIKNTDEKYYGREYTGTIDSAREAYDRYLRYADAVSGGYMTEHIMLSDTLVETVYSNGVRILINYSDAEQTAENITVPAKDFAVITEKE